MHFIFNSEFLVHFSVASLQWWQQASSLISLFNERDSLKSLVYYAMKVLIKKCVAFQRERVWQMSRTITIDKKTKNLLFMPIKGNEKRSVSARLTVCRVAHDDDRTQPSDNGRFDLNASLSIILNKSIDKSQCHNCWKWELKKVSLSWLLRFTLSARSQ